MLAGRSILCGQGFDNNKMMSAGVMSSKACIVRRPAAFMAPKASAPRMSRMRVVAEAEPEAAGTAKKAKAANLRHVAKSCCKHGD